LRVIPPADHPNEFVAGALALDFTNTLGGTHTAPTHEHIHRYEALVEFARSAGALETDDAKRLVEAARRQPARATEVLRRAVALREATWRVFSSLASETSPDESDLDHLMLETGEALMHSRFVRRGEAFAPDESAELSLERPLWPIARSAYDLLTSEHDIRWVRECASETCEWLFVDRSRSHTRRWCDMNDCGNRAKQRRLRQRAAKTKSR